MTGVESMAGESFSFEDVSEELAFLQKEVAKSRNAELRSIPVNCGVATPSPWSPSSSVAAT